jgi:membrane protein
MIKSNSAIKNNSVSPVPDTADAQLPAKKTDGKSLGTVFIASAKSWVNHRAASKGAALALYTLFSLTPLLVLVMSVASLFFDQETARRLLLEQLNSITGLQGMDTLKSILAGGGQHNSSAVAGMISAGILLVSAISAFSELKNSQDELWEIAPREDGGIWGFIRDRILSFGVLLVLMLMLITSLSVSAALAALGDVLNASISFHLFAEFLSDVISFAIVTLLFAIIFKYLPAVSIAWKDVILGALFTAILFIVGKAAISMYIGHGNFNSVYGTAGSIVALITWIYYSAQIFFYGSLFTHEYAVQLGSLAQAGKRQ